MPALEGIENSLNTEAQRPQSAAENPWEKITRNGSAIDFQDSV
jgi:hypothetical protein